MLHRPSTAGKIIPPDALRTNCPAGVQSSSQQGAGSAPAHRVVGLSPQVASPQRRLCCQCAGSCDSESWLCFVLLLLYLQKSFLVQLPFSSRFVEFKSSYYDEKTS